jgi:hypothetical protein
MGPEAEGLRQGDTTGELHSDGFGFFFIMGDSAQIVPVASTVAVVVAISPTALLPSAACC